MKRGRQDYPPQFMQPPKKKGKAWIFILVLAAVIFFYFYSSGSLKLPFNLGNVTSGNQTVQSSNPQIQLCIQNVNKCGQVISSKYDASVTVIESAETNSTSDANNFLKTWGPASQESDINSYNAGIPVILVATRFNNPDNSRTPHVFVCKSDGSLVSQSTTGLC